MKVNHNHRIPADILLLYTTDKTGSIYIRTDQLDGETDWKFRKAVKFTQELKDYLLINKQNIKIIANPPNMNVHDFKGYY